MDIGKQLRKARLSRGYSQQALAEKIGRDRSWVAKIEGGSIEVTWNDVMRILAALRIRRPRIKAA